MKVVVVTLLLVATLCGVCFGKTVNAIAADGFETILLDYPSYVHEFHYDYATEKFYAFGENIFRQINYWPGDFQAVDNFTLNKFDQNFIDVRLFSPPGSSDLWALGPTYTSSTSANTIGYFLPLSVIGPGPQDSLSFQGEKHGYTFYAVSVDYRNFSQVLAYFAGWAYIPGGEGTIAFTVTRAHIDLTRPPLGRIFTWNDTLDTVHLYNNSFQPFDSIFKPRILHDIDHNTLIIIDPADNTVFSVFAPEDGVSPMQIGNKVELTYRDKISGSTYHYYQDIIYVGVAAMGEHNGSIVEVDVKAMKILRRFEFQQDYYSNPRAIVGRNNTLYIGFQGGPSLLAFDIVQWKIIGSARLPAYLHQIYAGWDAGFDHVYFATYEQHSKVFRVSKKDFCTADCPENGFCQAGVCHCSPGYSLGSVYGVCEPTPTEITDIVVDPAAAIALGVLFGLTFIVAVAGWFMFYRSKKASYQRVL